MVGDSKCRSRPYYFRRCKKERPTTIDSLPDELLFSILVGLPADYLHDRARLVCRRWYHIIGSQSFIDSHHQRSTYCLLSSDYGRGRGRPIWMMSATSQGLIQTNEFNYMFRDKFMGTCNGLVLEMLSRENDTIILQIMNPATKKAFLLPPFTAPAGTYMDHAYCGIAYAAASMKYKVAISYYRRYPLSSGLAILSVGVDNSWRQFQIHHYFSEVCVRTLFCNMPLLTEGFMHWVDPSEGKKTVVTLDVETEIVTESELPYSPQSDPYNKQKRYPRSQLSHLFIKRGEDMMSKFNCLSTGRSLSLLSKRGEDMMSFFEMNPETKEWIKLKDDIKLRDKQQQRRLKQLDIRPDEYMSPLGWLKYPEVLVFSAYNSRMSRDVMISYNLNTHKINSTEFPVGVDHYTLTNAMYKNSLLWLT